MTTSARVVRVGFILALLAGCDGATGPTTSGTVEIFSWWTAAGEVEALEAVIDLHEEQHPGVTVVNAAAMNQATARMRLNNRLAQGLPPDTFQANAGADLLQWVLFNGTDDSGSLVEPLDDIVARNGWNTVFPDAVLRAGSYNGRLYGVPMNIHRINSLFYNRAVLETHGITPPTTLAEFEAACETLDAAGVTCLALAARDGWTVSMFTLENVFPAVGGPEFYVDFFSGRGDRADPRIREAAETTLRLFQYAPADARSLTWDQGVALVASGDAAFTVMGDWAKGYLAARGLTPGEDFGQIPFPGTSGTFVFTADMFALPRGAPNREGAVRLLETFASQEGQIRFNVLKGSIPARTDVAATSFDVLGRQQIEDFQSNTLVPALSALAPSAFRDPMGDALLDMLDRGSSEVFINSIVNYYDVLLQ